MVEPLAPTQSDPLLHRGYRLHYEYPPIPIRDYDWLAVDDNSDGYVVGNGATIEECRRDVDRYIEERES